MRRHIIAQHIAMENQERKSPKDKFSLKEKSTLSLSLSIDAENMTCCYGSSGKHKTRGQKMYILSRSLPLNAYITQNAVTGDQQNESGDEIHTHTHKTALSAHT